MWNNLIWLITWQVPYKYAYHAQLHHQWIQGALGAGQPLPPRFQAMLRGKNCFEQILGSGAPPPPTGVKTLLSPLGQNPGSASVHCAERKKHPFWLNCYSRSRWIRILFLCSWFFRIGHHIVTKTCNVRNTRSCFYTLEYRTKKNVSKLWKMPTLKMAHRSGNRWLVIRGIAKLSKSTSSFFDQCLFLIRFKKSASTKENISNGHSTDTCRGFCVRDDPFRVTSWHIQIQSLTCVSKFGNVFLCGIQYLPHFFKPVVDIYKRCVGPLTDRMQLLTRINTALPCGEQSRT